jgi:lysophospholipase L1-like esterase
VKPPGWTPTVVMVIGAAIFGLGFDHYQWFGYQALRNIRSAGIEQRSVSAEPHLKVSAAGMEHIRDRTEFFHQIEGGADVVMLGDSLTEGGDDWRELFPAFLVRNRGIAWDTTDGVLRRLNEVIGRKPKVVAVLIGINDVRTGVDPAIIITRIEEILRRLQASGTVPIMQSILLTISEPDTNATVTRVNAEIATWCAEEKITFLNLNAILAPSGTLDQAISTDGIHLNYTGYLRWTAALYPVLRRVLAQRTVDH